MSNIIGVARKNSMKSYLYYSQAIRATCVVFTTLLCWLIHFGWFQSAALANGIDRGGGDSCERRISEIREDLLGWITKGGAKDLLIPQGTSYDAYATMMSKTLVAPPDSHAVVVGCINEEQEKAEQTKKRPNPELNVNVDGQPKTCRWFISKRDYRQHILCKVERFIDQTSSSEQYSLIHHEFAGLVGVEPNDGAASSYGISSQITDYLESVPVLKLAVKSHDRAVADACDPSRVASALPGYTCRAGNAVWRIEEEQYEGVRVYHDLTSDLRVTAPLSYASTLFNAPKLCKNNFRLPSGYTPDVNGKYGWFPPQDSDFTVLHRDSVRSVVFGMAGHAFLTSSVGPCDSGFHCRFWVEGSRFDYYGGIAPQASVLCVSGPRDR